MYDPNHQNAHYVITRTQLLRGSSNNFWLCSRLLDGLVRGTLDDSAGDGKGSVTSEESVDVTSSHAAFVDTPDTNISMRESKQ